MEVVVIIALLIFVGAREYLSYKERNELVDRLMSRDIHDFKAASTPEENQLDTEEDDSIPLTSPFEVSEEDKEEVAYGGQETN